MAAQIIKGTWEEIERHKADLVGRQLHMTIFAGQSGTTQDGHGGKRYAKTENALGSEDACGSAQHRRISSREAKGRASRRLQFLFPYRAHAILVGEKGIEL